MVSSFSCFRPFYSQTLPRNHVSFLPSVQHQLQSLFRCLLSVSSQGLFLFRLMMPIMHFADAQNSAWFKGVAGWERRGLPAPLLLSPPTESPGTVGVCLATSWG